MPHIESIDPLDDQVSTFKRIATNQLMAALKNYDAIHHHGDLSFYAANQLSAADRLFYESAIAVAAAVIWPATPPKEN